MGLPIRINAPPASATRWRPIIEASEREVYRLQHVVQIKQQAVEQAEPEARMAARADLRRAEAELATARADLAADYEAMQAALTAEAQKQSQEAAKASLAQARAASKAGAKLTKELEDDAQAFGNKLKRLDALNSTVARHNRDYGRAVGMVEDGEMSVRTTPAKTIPAQFEQRKVWRNAKGQMPAFYKGDGKPGEPGFEEKEEKVMVAAARDVPARRPLPLVSTVHLPALRCGEAAIWEARP